jgi:hypothetical protein
MPARMDFEDHGERLYPFGEVIATGQSAARPMMCADPMRASPIRLEAGRNRIARSLKSNGIRANSIRATTVMSVIRRQRGSSTASCAGLQSRQFSAQAGDAGADQGVVADEPEGKADQDRREDRQPWPLCRVSDGRSRHSQKSLCRHSADDRGTAAAARCIDSVMRSVSRIPSKTGGKVRLDDGKFGKFSVRLDFGTSRPGP